MTTLYIDADACPVKAEAERVATRLSVPMVLVCNGGLRPSQNPLVTLQIVAEGPDMADRWIAETCGPGDVVVMDKLGSHKEQPVDQAIRDAQTHLLFLQPLSNPD